MRAFSEIDVPQLHSVAGLAFGPDGRWAVVNTDGPGVIDGTYTRAKGTVVVITGLPDAPEFSEPFPVPMHSLGNIDLSLNGGTLLLNDTTDFEGVSSGGPKSDQIIVRGIRPGSSPRVVGAYTFPTPAGYPFGPNPVRDARLTLDGRFVIAPIGLAREIDAQRVYLGVNQIAILGPVQNGKLELARLLTEADGVTGGPFQAGVSPDGDTALVTNVLDNGGANLVTGLRSADVTQIRIKQLPFQFFGPPFPLGPSGPAVLAPHGQAMFTPDGDTALVINWITPPVAANGVKPSLSVLTGFRSGNIHLEANLSDPTFNPIDQRQQIATQPSGLMDYLNLYLPAGEYKEVLARFVTQAIAAADGGDRNTAANLLFNFIETSSSRSVPTLATVATVGIQALFGSTEVVPAAGLRSGGVAPGSIATLFGAGFSNGSESAHSRPLPITLAGVELRIFDSVGAQMLVPLYSVSATRIDFLVPAGISAGPATLVVWLDGEISGAATFDVDRLAPGLFTANTAGDAAAVLQRLRTDGSNTVERIDGPIDLGAETDEVYLILFGTGLRKGPALSSVTALIGGRQVAVTYAGAQADFDGLDQVNLRLPRSLAGAGRVKIELIVAGCDANPVSVDIR